MRAFAILMMLQGHFVDTMLADVYRDSANVWYRSWAFMRGITAPVFFFSSGLVFTFLLSRSTKPWRENERVFKGLTRVLQLLFLGYLLRVNFPALLAKGELFPWFWGADVLHIIGLALLTVIGLYILHKETRIPLAPVLGLCGLAVFYLEPIIERGAYIGVPAGLSGYLVNYGFSTFTIFPWIGYTLLGGMAGVLLTKRPAVAHHPVLPAVLIGLGLLFHYYSIEALIALFQWTGWEELRTWRIENSHLLIRLGDVWVVYGIILLITRFWKQMPALIPKIGQETLVIYCVHYVLLFGTWFGLGIKLFGAHSLSPAFVVPGALLFVLFFVVLVSRMQQVERGLEFAKLQIRDFLTRSSRIAWWVLLRGFNWMYERLLPYWRLYRMKIRP